MAKSVLSAPHFHDEKAAFEKLESVLWPTGPVCPHCGCAGRITVVGGKTARMGLKRCLDCKKQFTVTVGTVFERSHVKLNLWLQAAHLLCSSKKGMSSHQIHRILGVTYRTAWFMTMRLREAMREGHFPAMLGGDGKAVEADETYVGGKEKNKHADKRQNAGRGAVGKEAVLSLVERGGKVRSHHVADVKASTLRPILEAQIHADSMLMTDEAAMYRSIGKAFTYHFAVEHSAGEYVRGGAHTNTIEGFFSVFKRGIMGTYHSVSQKHLKRYLAEFDFRYNEREALGVDELGACREGPFRYRWQETSIQGLTAGLKSAPEAKMEATQHTSGFTIYLEGIEAHQGNVLAHAFLSKAAKLISVLSALERAYLEVPQRQTDFEITGAEKVNPTTLTLKPIPKVNNYNPAPAFRWGMEQLARIATGEAPDSRVQGNIAREIVDLATKQSKDGYKNFWINGYSDAVRFDETFLANAARFAHQRAIEEAPRGWREGVASGSVIGELKKVDDLDGGQEFVVVPRVGAERVTCTFPDALRETMGNYLFKIVRVTGKLHYRADSPFPAKMEANAISEFPAQAPRRTLREMRGMFVAYEKPEPNWDDLLNA